jgi:O-succinylbenzoate synthase
MLRRKISINATLPAVNGRERIEEVLSWFPGCQVAKIKVGDNFKEDLARIKIAKDLIPNLQIRLDVNGRWTVEQARQFLNAIYAQIGHIQYVEQPCATIEELRELKRTMEVPVLIAGDEVIRKARDPFEVDLDGAVDIVMLKVAPLGGVARSLDLAKYHGLPVVVSSALESAVGIAHGLRLAGALRELFYACGLGTGSLLRADVGKLPIDAGAIEITSCEPSSQALDEFAAPKDRVLWWKERIRQTWEIGAEREVWSL